MADGEFTPSSTESTNYVEKRTCTNISKQSSSTTLLQEHFIPQIQFDDSILHTLTTAAKPPDKAEEEEEVVGFFCRYRYDLQDKSATEWADEKLTRHIDSLPTTIKHLRYTAKHREKLASHYKQLPCPWYSLRTKIPKIKISFHERFYCYPKTMVMLKSDFNDYKKIIQHYDHGINIFCFDLEHGTREMHKTVINCINKATEVINRTRIYQAYIAVGVEITHRKLRTGLNLHNDAIYIEKDSKVFLTAKREHSMKCTNRIIFINFDDYIRRFEKNDIIKISHGIILRIDAVVDDGVYCTVLMEGLLSSKANITIPIERTLTPLEVSKAEEADIKFAMQTRCDFVVCPCIYSKKLAKYIKWEMAAHHLGIIVFAKIDMSHDVFRKDIDFFLEDYSGLWLTGISSPENRRIEKYLLEKTDLENKPIVRDYVIQSKYPKIPCDPLLQKLYFLYPDCVVVTESERISASDVKHVIKRNFPDMNNRTIYFSTRHFLKTAKSVENIFIRQATIDALLERVTCIITVNNNGKSVCLLSKYRPVVPIVATVVSKEVARNLTMYRNVIPLIYYDPRTITWEDELSGRLSYGVEFARRYEYILVDEPFLICYDSHRGNKFSDVYRILYLDC